MESTGIDWHDVAPRKPPTFRDHGLRAQIEEQTAKSTGFSMAGRRVRPVGCAILLRCS